MNLEEPEYFENINDDPDGDMGEPESSSIPWYINLAIIGLSIIVLGALHNKYWYGCYCC